MSRQIPSLPLADARNMRPDPRKMWDPPPRRWHLGRLTMAVVLFVIVTLLLMRFQ
jgi:hypothetical protein